MKNIIALLILVSMLVGCAEAFRGKGEPYSGYSCEQSLLHFNSYCTQKKLTKQEFDAEIKSCEKQLSSGICDKEQAGLLWCMGRVAPGTYSTGGGVYQRGLYFGGGGTTDGCDCSTWIGAVKECKMKNGIFD